MSRYRENTVSVEWDFAIRKDVMDRAAGGMRESRAVSQLLIGKMKKDVGTPVWKNRSMQWPCFEPIRTIFPRRPLTSMGPKHPGPPAAAAPPSARVT